MSERATPDPITANAVAYMRRRRQQLGWSAADLADGCAAFGAAQVPPIPSSLSRSRIAKLENNSGTTLRVDEAWLLAAAFGVSLDDIITNSPEDTDLVPGEQTSAISLPRGALRDRVRTLEIQMTTVVGVLEDLGIRGLPIVGSENA